jgi:hypothetical protein
MRTCDMRFSVHWAVATVVLGAIVATVIAIERMDHLQSKVAIARSESAYRAAARAREAAESAVNDYALGTFRRELATAEAEIKQAEEKLSGIATDATGYLDWAERIRSKGYLLHITGASSKQLAVKKATFTLEQAKSKKLILKQYTRVKTLGDLNNQVARARMDELAKKEAYDRTTANPARLNDR